MTLEKPKKAVGYRPGSINLVVDGAALQKLAAGKEPLPTFTLVWRSGDTKTDKA